MLRQMIDCTSSAVKRVKQLFPDPQMVAWYGTGSPDIQWSLDDLALFPNSVKVEIDQGYLGSPVPTAVVRDVESGAWAPGKAVDRTGWNVERPTIYCTRDTLPSVIADGWKGDVWLAQPGYVASVPPVYQGVNIVAVQSVFADTYDMSVVYDPDWPRKSLANPASNTLSVTVNERSASAAWGRYDGASHYVIEYQASSRVASVLVGRIPQIISGIEVHASPLHIPGASGGMIHFYAIVNGNAVPIGTRILP